MHQGFCLPLCSTSCFLSPHCLLYSMPPYTTSLHFLHCIVVSHIVPCKILWFSALSNLICPFTLGPFSPVLAISYIYIHISHFHHLACQGPMAGLNYIRICNFFPLNNSAFLAIQTSTISDPCSVVLHFSFPHSATCGKQARLKSMKSTYIHISPISTSFRHPLLRSTTCASTVMPSVSKIPVYCHLCLPVMCLSGA
jgi:hypothetical protein